MKAKILIILSLVSLSLCYDIMVGSYTRDSFAKNDAKINSALNLVKSEVANKFNNKNLSILPVAIYSQIVNGINYKIVVGIKDSSTGKIDLAHSIVYTGPFSDNFAQETPTLTFFQTLPNDALNVLDEEKTIGINSAISNYLKNAQASLVSTDSVVSYPNLVYTESFYIVNVTVKNSSGANESQIFIVNLRNDNTYTVTNVVRK